MIKLHCRNKGVIYTIAGDLILQNIKFPIIGTAT